MKPTGLDHILVIVAGQRRLDRWKAKTCMLCSVFLSVSEKGRRVDQLQLQNADRQMPHSSRLRSVGGMCKLS